MFTKDRNIILDIVDISQYMLKDCIRLEGFFFLVFGEGGRVFFMYNWIFCLGEKLGKVEGEGYLTD